MDELIFRKLENNLKDFDPPAFKTEFFNDPKSAMGKAKRDNLFLHPRFMEIHIEEGDFARELQVFQQKTSALQQYYSSIKEGIKIVDKKIRKFIHNYSCPFFHVVLYFAVFS